MGAEEVIRSTPWAYWRYVNI